MSEREAQQSSALGEEVPNETKLLDSTKLCSSCFELIDTRASVCPKCRMYQGAYWYIRLIGVSLPWVVGSLSLISFAYSYYHSQFPQRTDPINLQIYAVSPGTIKIVALNPLGLTVYVEPYAALLCGSETNAAARFSVHLEEVTSQFLVPAHDARLLTYTLSKNQRIPAVSDVRQAECRIAAYIGDGDRSVAETDKNVSRGYVETLLSGQP